MTSSGIKLIDVVCPCCGSNSNKIVASGYDFEYVTSKGDFFFRECHDCRVMYLSPRPDITELSKIYPPEYNPFRFHDIKNPIVRWGRNLVQQRKVSAIKNLLPKKANIIDVGCGSGSLLILLKKYGNIEWNLYGNDFKEEVLQGLRELGIQKILGRFEEVDLDFRFDLIILNQTIEHLDYPDQVVKKAWKLLNPRGLLYLETPSAEGLDAIIFRKRYWGGYHIPRHWVIFSSKSIKALLTRHAFKEIGIFYMASPSFWIQSFHHYFLDKNFPKWWVKLWVFKNPFFLSFFTLLDIMAIMVGRPTSNMRVVARKE